MFAISCNTSIHQKQIEKRNIPVELCNGDIVFRRGIGVASQAVLFANSQGTFSHVGVAVNIDDKWNVLHEVPYEGENQDDDKIHCEPIEDFFNTDKASCGAVYRLKGIDTLKQQIIKEYLKYKLACDVPFDHEYDLDDSTKLYCTELVWRSYLEAGVDITKGSRTEIFLLIFNGMQILPCDIESNEDLELIYMF
ncbi:MAG: YiiX/YebB-like N1pC/P60 family cysteine hydrolase [Rikenellaceae bacterium]